MGRKYLFSTNEKTGHTREIKVDPKNLDKQIREERAAGRIPTVLTEDERIQAGLTAQWISEQHRKGRI